MKLLLFFACTLVSPIISMDHINDARTLAQGHSTDGWVNQEKVAEIAQALETIKQQHTHLADIHVAERTFDLMISWPKDADLEGLENQVSAITENFNGKHRALNPILSEKTQQTVKAIFDNRVDIPALIAMYKNIKTVTARPVAYASFGYFEKDILLIEKGDMLEFKFDRYNNNTLLGKFFTVTYDKKAHNIISCEEE